MKGCQLRMPARTGDVGTEPRAQRVTLPNVMSVSGDRPPIAA